MTFTQRTHTCGELGTKQIGSRVTLNGWVASQRDLGAMVFVDVRDRYGISQAVFDSASVASEVFASGRSLRSEFVVAISGTVRKREKENPNLATGQIEILADAVEILNAAETPPIEIGDDSTASEEQRLKYRISISVGDRCWINLLYAIKCIRWYTAILRSTTLLKSKRPCL